MRTVSPNTVEALDRIIVEYDSVPFLPEKPDDDYFSIGFFADVASKVWNDESITSYSEAILAAVTELEPDDTLELALYTDNIEDLLFRDDEASGTFDDVFVPSLWDLKRKEPTVDESGTFTAVVGTVADVKTMIRASEGNVSYNGETMDLLGVLEIEFLIDLRNAAINMRGGIPSIDIYIEKCDRELSWRAEIFEELEASRHTRPRSVAITLFDVALELPNTIST